MICSLCPRNCHAERTEEKGMGFCGMPTGLRVARAALHMWEEPVVSGESGSGTVFFSGCTLRCIFCQNHQISAQGFGKEIDVERLKEIFYSLIDQGANNINLVTPTHYLPWILQALDEPLPVPVVYNCGGYEKVETLRTMEGKIQVYLPDMKYMDGNLAEKLSGARDYPEVAKEAILEMYRQVGPCVIENGLIKSGVIIRHLVLPGEMENTRSVIDWVSETFTEGEVLFSLMSQYTPQPGSEGKLARHVTKAEYRSCVEYMKNCRIENGFVQERTSAKEEYTPPFDLTGI